jgi:carboxypeptidase Taq
MSLAALNERIGVINDVLNSWALLYWDSRTMMPPGGSDSRSRQVSTMKVLAHGLLVADETRHLLDAAEREVAGRPPEDADRRIVAQTREAVRHHLKIPADLIRRRAQHASAATAIWVKARAEGDFAVFAPYLEKTVAMARELADAIGYDGHPYDALMYQFEPGETVASLRTLFSQLRAGIGPVVKATTAAPPPRSDFLERHYEPEKQAAFAKKIAAKLGYDFDRGRLDGTVHPFEISFTRNDVRITTRFYPDYLPASLFGTMHEAGHGLYEQGVDPAYTRTTLATDLVGLYAVGGVSFGAHESQSRLWENHIGRSRRFWDLHYGMLQEEFPDALGDIDVATFHRAINKVRPGFIRVEADELTYDFHVMLRVDLETRLVDGSLQVKDVPEAWNAALKQELGLEVPNHRLGCLQDIHWSSGQIGTFCNYTIGNVMAAQVLEQARAEDPSIQIAVDAGDYTRLKDWLTRNIYVHGRRFSRDELLQRITGRKLDARPYIRYLRDKYAALYGVTV